MTIKFDEMINDCFFVIIFSMILNFDANKLTTKSGFFAVFEFIELRWYERFGCYVLVSKKDGYLSFIESRDTGQGRVLPLVRFYSKGRLISE